MPKTIEGTEETQELIINIINNLRAQKPLTKHVDYIITVGKNSSLHTEENDGILRNVSIIKLDGLYVAIGNKTGDLLVRKKPWLMSSGKVLKKVTRFLKMVQPERLALAKKVDMSSFADSSLFSAAPECSRITRTYKNGFTKIQRTINGTNSDATPEFVEEYKTL